MGAAPTTASAKISQETLTHRLMQDVLANKPLPELRAANNQLTPQAQFQGWLVSLSHDGKFV